MGPRPPPWVPLLKSYGSSILSTSLGSKTLNNTSLGLGGTKIYDPIFRQITRIINLHQENIVVFVSLFTDPCTVKPIFREPIRHVVKYIEKYLNTNTNTFHKSKYKYKYKYSKMQMYLNTNTNTFKSISNTNTNTFMFLYHFSHDLLFG